MERRGYFIELIGSFLKKKREKQEVRYIYLLNCNWRFGSGEGKKTDTDKLSSHRRAWCVLWIVVVAHFLFGWDFGGSKVP